MSLLSPKSTCIPHNQRKEIIKEYVSEETYNEIAERCRCKKRTIIRDVNIMKATGEWWEYLERAMLRYGRKTTVSDTAKFNKYADLYAKQFITSKEESKVEHSGKISVDINKLLEAYKDIYEEETGETSPIQEDNIGEPVDTL